MREVVEHASCDVCGSVEAIESFTIVHNRRTVIVDACVKHAEPIHALIDAGSDKPTRQTKAPTERGGHAVVPIEDLQE